MRKIYAKLSFFLQQITISPKVFRATLDNIFRKLDWNKEGLSMDGEHLSHVKFTDDIFRIAESTEALQ